MSQPSGKLIGVGVGPGDPELITVKAVKAIQSADVIAYHCAQHGRSVAGGIASDLISDSQPVLKLIYPVTTEATAHPGGYDAAILEFYERSAEQLAEQLANGLTVALLCEGDPMLYGSYMYMHERLAGRFETQVIPGITSYSAAAAGTGTPLCKREDTVTIIPGTLPQDVLEQRLAQADAAVILKLGRNFDKIRTALDRTGKLDRALYVERASSTRERSGKLAEIDGDVPYMSLALVPGIGVNYRLSQTADAGVVGSPIAQQLTASGSVMSGPAAKVGQITVVGMGPGPDHWQTPEAAAVLREATDIVGYDTYVKRVPKRIGQTHHASDNRVEIDRATHALQLAAEGRKVAVVSSGDAGIFAMASAVLEALETNREQLGHVPVLIVPGLSAMQAVASRVGAPLGHDFAVISLSDQLKPWELVEKRIRAVAQADMAMAFYNPASKTRREQLDQAIEALREYRTPETPVVVARAVGSDQEAVTVTTLGDLNTSIVDMRTMLIVGSSATTVLNTSGGDYVYTLRSVG